MEKKDKTRKEKIDKSKKKVLKEIEKSENTDKTEPGGSTIDSDNGQYPGQSKKQLRTEKKKQKELKRKNRSLPLKISIFSLKTLFLRIPVVFAILILFILIGLKLFLTPSTTEKLLIKTYNNLSYGTLDLKVKEFNPYTGFVFENIVIRNGKYFNNARFAQINKVSVQYSFFKIFTGSIQVPEVGIYKPRVYIKERNGIWNFSRLLKPGKEKEIKVPEKEDKTVDTSDEINLPVSLDLLFKFILDDLRIYADTSTFKSSMESITFSIDVLVPPFNKIPKSIEAASLLEKMNLVLNPNENMKVSFFSKNADARPPLILTWNTIFSKQKKSSPQFNSSFRFGTYKTPVRFKKTHLMPLNFMISYDMFYKPMTDILELNHFKLSFKDKQWIYLSGNVKSVTKKQIVKLKMEESSIDLNDLYPYFKSITGDRRTRFEGKVSILPLQIDGNLSKMAVDVNGKLAFTQLGFKSLTAGAEAALPRIILDYSINMLKEDIKVFLKLSIPRFNYILKGSRSGDNGLEFKADIHSFEFFKKIIINDITFKFYNPANNQNVLDMKINGNAALVPNVKGLVKINRFRFTKGPLMAMMPDRFHKMLKNIPLKKPVSMKLGLNFYMDKKIISGKLNSLFKVPDFEANDLRLNLNVLTDSALNHVNLKQFNLYSKLMNLSVNANGTVDREREPISDSDLNISVKMNNSKMKKVFGPWLLSGLVDVKVKMKGDLENGKASGVMKASDFYVKNKDMMLDVQNFNMDFPFEYAFKPKSSGESVIAIDKEKIIDNDFFKEKSNFTISSISYKHPSREIPLQYMKDFSASMYFRDKVFRIINLQAYVFDGSMQGKEILFNLADFKPENMEFSLIMDITNMDIGKLDKVNQKSRDAELSLNANFSGRGLNIKKELNAKGYINIHKIGNKFASQLMKGLSVKEDKSKLGKITQFAVDNTMKIKSFNFYLDKGLVYATVHLSRKFLSFVASIEKNKIEFERMPIQEYLRKVRKGD